MPTPEAGGSDEHRQLADSAYRYHGPLLREIAERKFRIPPADAENLVNEVFVAYLRRRSAVDNLEKWLVGAVCNASRGYWRTTARHRTEPLPSSDEWIDALDPDPEDRIIRHLLVAAGLQRLKTKCRKTISMYYGHGYSAAEIATALDTSVGYVMQLLHTCRKHARVVFRRLLGKRR